MFRPAKMAKIDLQVPQDYIAKTTSIISSLKILHLMNIRKTRVGELDLESEADSNLLRKYSELKERLEKIFRVLDIKENNQLSETYPYQQDDVNPQKDFSVIEKTVQQLEGEIFSFIKAIESPEKAKAEKENLLRQLEIFSQIKIDLNLFCDCKFLYAASGFIPSDNIGRLELSLSNIYHLYIPSTTFSKRRLIFVFGSRKDKEKIEKALKSAYFEKIEIPHYDHAHDINFEILKGKIKKLEMENRLAGTRLEKLRNGVEKKLADLNRKVKQSLTLLEIGKSFDKVGDTYHISGWIPQKVTPTLKKKVLEVTDQQSIVSVSIPNGDRKYREKFTKIPTCFQNPAFFRPFEKLVSEYAIPSYHEVEPTVFFALSFLLMFGVMFGDIGHGFILFIGGLLTLKKSKKENIRDIGLIIMECGFMSTFFGFLYGSIFGFEHIIPPLWFNPMENISYFMKVTIVFGIIVISIGLILNIINSIMNSDYKTGIFGEFGIMGLIFYWGCIGLAIIYLATGKFQANFGYIFLILFLPLLIIFFKEPLFNLYTRIIHKRNLSVFPENIGIYLLESFIEVNDIVIGFLSNTVSFIRISAFALAHAGLFLAVFALANTLQDLKGGILWYWIIMILGNMGIIVIESVIVTIQTIRLEYYEFFGKFFKGGGEIYKPVKI